MTPNKLFSIVKFVALALALINALMLVVAIICSENIVGPLLGLVVMVILYVVLSAQGKMLNKK